MLTASLDGKPLDLKRTVPRGAGHPRPDGRDGRARGAALAPKCRWRWSTTNMAISTASSRRAASSRRWPAPSRTTSMTARTRRWSSARTAAGWCRARPAPTCSPTGSASACPPTAIIRPSPGFALVGAQATPGDRRDLQARRLVVRDRRHGRPQDRQADRVAAQGEAASGEGGSVG